MSFDVYVTAFKDGSEIGIPVSELTRRFSKHINSDDKYGYWRLHYDEGPCLARLWTDKAETTNGFSVSRPPDYLAFWDIIGGILKDLPCVLYWPGDKAVMGSLDMLRHLPDDFVEIMDVPWVSTDGERIRQYVWDHS